MLIYFLYKFVSHCYYPPIGQRSFGPMRAQLIHGSDYFQNANDKFHHSIEKDAEGNIWAPSHIYPQSLPIEKVGRNIIYESGYYDDAIVKLSADGEILFEKSVSQIFIDNGLEYLLFSVGDRK